MSFTPLLRQAALAPGRAPAASAFRFVRAGGVGAVRTVSGSAPQKAAAKAHDGHHDAHGDHHGDHHAEDADPDVYQHESMLKPSWRPFWAVLAATILAWPFIPSPVSGSFSPSLDPEGFRAARNDPNVPRLTRFLLGQMTEASVTEDINDANMALMLDKARAKVLVTEAERPPIRRMRYPSSFEQASPFQVAPGSQVDLGDLKVRPSGE